MLLPHTGRFTQEARLSWHPPDESDPEVQVTDPALNLVELSATQLAGTPSLPSHCSSFSLTPFPQLFLGTQEEKLLAQLDVHPKFPLRNWLLSAAAQVETPSLYVAPSQSSLPSRRLLPQ
jgi:hypothetical protein